MAGPLFRSPATLAALLLLSLLTPTAFPDVTLISQQARTGSGNWSSGPLGSTSNPTTWTTNTNFTTADPSGLHLNITRTGSAGASRGAPVQMTLNASWNIQDFQVVFRVDEPTPYTVFSEGSFGSFVGGFSNVYPRLARLADQNGTTIFPTVGPNAFSQTQTGVLQPGTYTFNGSVGYEVPFGQGPPPNSPAISDSGSFTAELTVGVPEPATLPAVLAALVFASRRKR